VTALALSSRVDDSTARLSARVQSRVLARRGRAELDREAGMTTAEYAVGTVGACGLAGVIFKILTSPDIKKVIEDMIVHAFKRLLPW
jgi:hypothetical protein